MCWALLYIKFSPLINFLTTCFLHSFCTLLCWHAPLRKKWNNIGFATLIFFLQKNYKKGESERESLSVVYDSWWLPGLYNLRNSPGQNTGMEIFPFSRGPSQPRDHPRSPASQLDSFPAEPQGKPENTGEGSLPLLQWIFQTQELNQCLLYCRWFIYQLNIRKAQWPSPSIVFAKCKQSFLEILNITQV